MKTFILIVLHLMTVIVGDPETNESELDRNLSEYFFGLSVKSDIDTMKKQLAANPDFTFYQDPNRNVAYSIVGSMATYKHINPGSIRSQLIIQCVPAGGRTNVLFKLSVDYRREDLQIALVDTEKLKSVFRPLFTDASEKIEIGYHQEEIETLTLKNSEVTLTIRILKFNSTNHTVSLEYRSNRRSSKKG